tara:strand:+ start:139 stop:726 length:588 start_codon:yes stop_codon:yes gene_type:complete
MAFKMKGAPMHDLSSKHGTNANYKKSGAPGLLDKVVDPLGLKKKLMGGDKNCPPPGQQAPVIGAAKPVEPVTPTTPTPVEQPVVDPNAGVSGQGTPAMPMKKNLKVGAPMKASPMQKGETSTWDKIKSAASAVTSSLGKVNPVGYPLSERISDKYKKNKKEYRESATKEKNMNKTDKKIEKIAKKKNIIRKKNRK